MCACVSACTVYGLGNHCSDNDEKRQSGVTFHLGVQARSDLTLKVKVRGQMCSVRFSGIAAIDVKIVYHG